MTNKNCYNTLMPVDKSNFVPPNDPILKKKAAYIPPDKISSKEIQSIIERMLDIAYGKHDRTKAVLVGLAAPQIGISKRIILVDELADGKGTTGDLRVFINPEITSTSKEETEWYEGCWSTDRVTGIVSRPTSISVQAYTKEGKLISETYQGYTARIFQHEIDHLSGNEFVTHITDPKKLHWVEDDEWVSYRNNEVWRTWSHLCPFEKWEKIKGIV